MFVKQVVPSRAVRLYTCAAAGVAAPIAAATSRRSKDLGPTPSMTLVEGNSDTEAEFPEVSRGSGSLVRSARGGSLTGRPISDQPRRGFRTPIDGRVPINYGWASRDP